MHYRRGKRALQKVVEALELRADTPARDQANAIAELGDWYLVFGQRASANHAYKLAYDFLGDSEQPEDLREALFGSAKLIEFTDHSSKTSPFITAVSKAEAAVEKLPIEKPPAEDPPIEEPFSDQLAEQNALDEKAPDQQPLDQQPMEISMAITSNGVPKNIEIINCDFIK